MPTSTGSSNASAHTSAPKSAGWWKLPAPVGIRAVVVAGPVRLADELLGHVTKVLTFVLRRFSASPELAAVRRPAMSVAATPVAATPGSTPIVATPIPEYDSLSATRAIAAIRELVDVPALEQVARQERAGKARVTVINAIDQRVRSLSADSR